jgi:hypothetical protein
MLRVFDFSPPMLWRLVIGGAQPRVSCVAVCADFNDHAVVVCNHTSFYTPTNKANTNCTNNKQTNTKQTPT